MKRTFKESERDWRIEIQKALGQYNPENIDIMCNEETGWLYIGYHSDNNSFPISNELMPKEIVKRKFLEKLADEYDIGICF